MTPDVLAIKWLFELANQEGVGPSVLLAEYDALVCDRSG